MDILGAVGWLKGVIEVLNLPLTLQVAVQARHGHAIKCISRLHNQPNQDDTVSVQGARLHEICWTSNSHGRMTSNKCLELS